MVPIRKKARERHITKAYILYVRRILSSKLLRYTEIMPSMKDFSYMWSSDVF